MTDTTAPSGYDADSMDSQITKILAYVASNHDDIADMKLRVEAIHRQTVLTNGRVTGLEQREAEAILVKKELDNEREKVRLRVKERWQTVWQFVAAAGTLFGMFLGAAAYFHWEAPRQDSTKITINSSTGSPSKKP